MIFKTLAISSALVTVLNVNALNPQIVFSDDKDNTKIIINNEGMFKSEADQNDLGKKLDDLVDKKEINEIKVKLGRNLNELTDIKKIKIMYGCCSQKSIATANKLGEFLKKLQEKEPKNYNNCLENESLTFNEKHALYENKANVNVELIIDHIASVNVLNNLEMLSNFFIQNLTIKDSLLDVLSYAVSLVPQKQLKCLTIENTTFDEGSDNSKGFFKDMLTRKDSSNISLVLNNAGCVEIPEDATRISNISVLGETVLCKEGDGEKEKVEIHGGAISYLNPTVNLLSITYKPCVNSVLDQKIAARMLNVLSFGLISYDSMGYKGYAGLALEVSGRKYSFKIDVDDSSKMSVLYFISKDLYNNVSMTKDPCNVLKNIIDEADLKKFAKKKITLGDAYTVAKDDDSFLWVLKSREDLFKSKDEKNVNRISISFNETNQKFTVKDYGKKSTIK